MRFPTSMRLALCAVCSILMCTACSSVRAVTLPPPLIAPAGAETTRLPDDPPPLTGPDRIEQDYLALLAAYTELAVRFIRLRAWHDRVVSGEKG